MLPFAIVTGPSESFALISAVTAPGGGAETLIMTESVEEAVPLTHVRVSVVGVDVDGYHACPGEMGPPIPVVLTLETPEGDVSIQLEAFVEDQLYE